MVSGGVMTDNELCTGRDFYRHLLGPNWHPALRADANRSAQAPDKGPPRAGWDRPQDSAFLFFGQIAGLLRFHLQFAVKFVLITVQAQVADMGVGLVHVEDVLAGEVSR